MCRNSIYCIHTSYYSILLSLFLINLFIIIYNLINYYYFFNISLFILISNSIWLIIYNWINDIFIEGFIYFTFLEQINIIIGIKLMIISELMLFITCFWCLINFRIIFSSILFIFPLFSSYAFSIPFSNLLLLVLSSYPLNGSQIAIKNGDLLINIYLLFITLLFGLFFILLQLKEFLYSYFSLSDCYIGSIFYFTTGLHGFHVILGSYSLFIILYLLLITFNFFFIEYSLCLFLTSFYWHFVDFIWLI